MHERTKRPRGLANELVTALDAGQLEVHYQPIVRLGDTRPTAVEALVRWAHPTRGLLPPAEFVPIAEALGLMERLGAWVLHRACIDMAAFAPDLDLCVNVSDTQIVGLGLVATVLDTLVETGFRADRLVLEVCERTVVPDLVLVLDHLKAGFNVGKIIRSANVFGIREVHLVGIPPFDPGPTKGALRHTRTRRFATFSEFTDAEKCSPKSLPSERSNVVCPGK